MYANAPYLGLRADSPISFANGCVAGSDCTSECSFEIYRPASADGDVLTDRVQVICTLQNPRAPRGMNSIYLTGLIDGLSVSYRPKIDGERSVAIKGPFATELFFSFQKALQSSRYIAKLASAGAALPKNTVYQYLVPKNYWYFLFKLDTQSPIPGDSNLSLLCSPPPNDIDDSTCVFRL